MSLVPVRRVSFAPVTLVAVLLAATLAICWGLPAAAAADAGGAIGSTLRQAGLSGPQSGVYVWDLDAARLVYQHDATTMLAPASNLKLITSAAALMDWGAGHRFTTELYEPDVPVSTAGTLYGNVYLRGEGDPSLSMREYQREVLELHSSTFQALAAALRKEGVKKVQGGVVGDASWFDKRTTAPAWKPGLQLECGPLSALSGDEGLKNGNRVKAPAIYAARLMTQALRGAGVKVTGKPSTGIVPASARLVKQLESAPLSAIMAHMDKESDNFFAEMLCKGLGKDLYGAGTTAAGAQASRAALQALGIKDDTYVILDGSGLSYDDRVTPLDLVRVLGAMRRRDDFDVYYDALAVAGVDGTLEDRMRGTAAEGNAHAKTGTLDVAVSLSGYVESANDHLVAFSMLLNGGSVGTSGWEKATGAEDTIVAALARATLPGDKVLTVTPKLRDFSVSAVEPVHGVGGRLEPGVQP